MRDTRKHNSLVLNDRLIRIQHSGFMVRQIQAEQLQKISYSR